MPLGLPYRRLWLLTVLLVAAFAGLGARLVHLQVLRHGELLEKARENTERTFLRQPRRGDIRDARGNLLATTVPVKTVCADPTLIGNRQARVAAVLAPLLKTNQTYLLERLQLRVLRTETNGQPVFDKHVVLKHKVRLEEWERIQQAMAKEGFGCEGRKLGRKDRTFLRNLQRKAIFTEDDQLRVYPNQTLAAHVLGHVGPSEDGKNLEGKDGIERVLNSKLSGAKGWLQTERDHGGAELVANRQQEVRPSDGLNVVLTLDAGLQYIVETELAEGLREQEPISISATIVRPRTGEILAMANLPTFDPNKPGDVADASRRNRIITDLAEPGSTFKIVVVAAALNEGVVRLQDRFDCEHGRFLFAGKVLHDLHPYGILSVEQIIAKSSNIGAAKVGIKLGQERLYEHVRNFGFGHRTGLPLLGEISGIVHPLSRWTKLSISRIPMGHEIAVTPLQMVMAMSTIANDGKLMRPMLVDRLEDDEGNVVAQYKPQFVRQTISPAAARQMVIALKQVVSTNGTANRAKLDHFVVAGKTGTAEKVGPGGYERNKNFSSFLGFFPADDPELCISVVLDEPKRSHVGGLTAAPIFQRIAERAANYLGLRPDLPPAQPPTEARARVSHTGPRLVAQARSNL
ncbi:MAG: penicillin-binding protein 2 [Verrucomicrobia bacterium]|nr:penicillin-binding protein 2 [Verrucomicrobiota bacterium]